MMRKSYSVTTIQNTKDIRHKRSKSAMIKGKKDMQGTQLPSPESKVGYQIRLNFGSMNNVQQVDSLTENFVTIRDEFRFSLINEYGPQRANRLYEKHAKRSHYLLINAEEDNDKAAMVRAFLEGHHDRPNIKGRWDIPLGSQRLAEWEQLLQSATVVLVFLSRALCEDEILSLIFPSLFILERLTVPLYLENFSLEEMERKFRSHLRPVLYYYGIKLYDQSVERIKEDIDNLHAKHKSNFGDHYSQEIAALEGLVDRINSPNVCPCGEC
ncbi:uncharacterized protein [Palaemon carinicauda]|uniref:uncharacterized protein n=1 Tax=Palaemon carinicauda TaxID=392227 RepID=UPI0035B6426E